MGNQITTEIVNIPLMNNVEVDTFEKLGFINCYDFEPITEANQPDTVWGISWEMENDKFSISIDCAYVVTLRNKVNESEGIKVHCLDVQDLEMIIDFISE